MNFAVKEDAIRAVETKNGAALQGRKIKVELAKRRAPLDARHPKGKRKDAEGTKEDEKNVEGDSMAAMAPEDKGIKKRKVSDGEDLELSHGTAVESKLTNGRQPAVKPDSKKRPREEGKASESQRTARTVIIGCLENPKMVQAAIAKAKRLGKVEDVRHPVPEAELISRGLAKDGCKQEAVEVRYTSVKVAHQAVTALHKQNVGGGGAIWARQLGGEGAKLKKWRLIVRNLPFMLKEQTLRQLFSPLGFVWEVTIPRKPDNSSKGFAFVGFTCKADAEKAIQTVNGTLVSKRPIAVDWAVAKKEYETAASKTSVPEATEDDVDETASEDESDEGSEDGNDEDSEDEDGSGSEEDVKHSPKVTKKMKVDSSNLKQSSPKVDIDIESSDEEDVDDEDDDEGEESEKDKEQVIDFSEEKDLAKRILKKVTASSKTKEQDNVQLTDSLEIGGKQTAKQKSSAKETKPAVKETKTPKVADTVKNAKKVELAASQDDGLSRTVFVRNLPLEANVQDLRRQFSDFGEVKAFRLVLHPITKRPKGTAFVEFVTAEGAQEAIAAASRTEADGGLVVGGRNIIMNLALDRDKAKQVARELSKEQDDHDRRHLKLAKEGVVEEGTPAAQGLSKGDLMKRKQVEHEKATKLRSPNFHVSTTRLAVHNIPKDMTEKELKQLFIQAVKSKASKQNPALKQVKILRDEVKGVPGSSGKSRGAAFVEFTEHQHALVALRVLNNNPETFGSEHRPIIQFAIENSQKLKLRATREALAKGRQARNAATARPGDGSSKGKKFDSKKDQESFGKRTAGVGNSADDGNEVDDSDRRVKRKREKKNKKKEAGQDTKNAASEELVTDSKITMKGKKLQKPHDRKRQKFEVGAGNQEFLGKNKSKQSSSDQSLSAKPSPEKVQANKKPRVTPEKSPQNRKTEKTTKPTAEIPQHKSPAEQSRRRKNQPEIADKLDQLVSEYRTKYFNTSSGTKSKSSAQPDADLKRWFE